MRLSTMSAKTRRMALTSSIVPESDGEEIRFSMDERRRAISLRSGSAWVDFDTGAFAGLEAVVFADVFLAAGFMEATFFRVDDLTFFMADIICSSSRLQYYNLQKQVR